MTEFPPTDIPTDEPDADTAAGQPKATDPKSRPVYNGTSESTRSMRDTSRRRRDAEVKLQQHLMEAKDHVPHHYEDDTDQDDGGSEEGQGAEAPRA